MVSSTHWIASQTAMAVLERGGNAFDAAVAAGFVLQVVVPHLNGPGGDLPIILWDARRAAVEVICGQGPAPKAATTSHFRSLGLDDIPGTGLLAACVPGAFGGWLRLLADHGSMRLRDVMQPAIDYAGSGYPLVAAISDAIAQVEALFRDEWHESARVSLDPIRLFEPPTSQRRTRASSTRRNAPAATATARSTPRCKPSIRGSWPRRSTTPAACRRWTARGTGTPDS